MEDIQKYYAMADDCGLAVEVIFYALKIIRNNPALTPVDAMRAAAIEWDIL